jgi:hypothetical protein
MSDGRAVAPHQQGNTHFSMEREMRSMNLVQGVLYIRERYPQLLRLSCLVIGCRLLFACSVSLKYRYVHCIVYFHRES